MPRKRAWRWETSPFRFLTVLCNTHQWTATARRPVLSTLRDTWRHPRIEDSRLSGVRIQQAQTCPESWFKPDHFALAPGLGVLRLVELNEFWSLGGSRAALGTEGCELWAFTPTLLSIDTLDELLKLRTRHPPTPPTRAAASSLAFQVRRQLKDDTRLHHERAPVAYAVHFHQQHTGKKGSSVHPELLSSVHRLFGKVDKTAWRWLHASGLEQLCDV